MTVNKEINIENSNNIKRDKYAFLKCIGEDKISFKVSQCTKGLFIENYIESISKSATAATPLSLPLLSAKNSEKLEENFKSPSRNEKESKSLVPNSPLFDENEADIKSENTSNVHSTYSVKDRIKFFTTIQKNQYDSQQADNHIIKNERKSTLLDEKIAAIQKNFGDSSAIQKIVKDKTLTKEKEILTQSLSVKDKVNHFNSMLQNTGSTYRIKVNCNVDTKKLSSFFEKQNSTNSKNEIMKNDFDNDLKDSKVQNLFNEIPRDITEKELHPRNDINIMTNCTKEEFIEKNDSIIIKEENKNGNVPILECPSIQGKVSFFNNICYSNRIGFNIKLNEKIDSNTVASFFKDSTINKSNKDKNFNFKRHDIQGELEDTNKNELNEIKIFDNNTKNMPNDYCITATENILKNERNKNFESFNYEYKTEKGKDSETFKIILNRLNFGRKSRYSGEKRKFIALEDENSYMNILEPLNNKKYKKNHVQGDKDHFNNEILTIVKLEDNDLLDISVKSDNETENEKSINSLHDDHSEQHTNSNLRKFSTRILAINNEDAADNECFEGETLNNEALSLYDSDEDLEIETENLGRISENVVFEGNLNFLETIFEEDEDTANIGEHIKTEEEQKCYSETEGNSLQTRQSTEENTLSIKEHQHLNNVINEAFIADSDLDKIHEDLEFWYTETNQSNNFWQEIQPADFKATNIIQRIQILEKLFQNLENRQNRLRKIEKQISICNENVQTMINECNNFIL